MSLGHADHPRELLSPYLDGELEKDARSAVESHVAGCVACRTLLQDFRSMAAAAALETPPPVPADLRARIRRALEGTEAPGAAAFGRAIWSHRLGLAAAAAAVLVIGLVALRREPVQPGGPPVPQMRSFEDTGHEVREEREAVPSPPRAAQRKPSNVAPRQERPPAPRTPVPAAESSTAAAPTPAGERGYAEVPGRRAGPGRAAATPGSEEPPQEVMSRERGLANLNAADTAAGARATATGAPRGRSLMVEFPAFSVSVREDGTIALSAIGYSCAARADGTSVDPDIAALFALASSSGDEAPGAPGPAPGGAPVVRLLEPPGSAGEAEGFTAGRAMSARRADEIQARLGSLLRDRYLALIEAGCGPAPRAVRSP